MLTLFFICLFCFRPSSCINVKCIYQYYPGERFLSSLHCKWRRTSQLPLERSKIESNIRQSNHDAVSTKLSSSDSASQFFTASGIFTCIVSNNEIVDPSQRISTASATVNVLGKHKVISLSMLKYIGSDRWYSRWRIPALDLLLACTVLANFISDHSIAVCVHRGWGIAFGCFCL